MSIPSLSAMEGFRRGFSSSSSFSILSKMLRHSYKPCLSPILVKSEPTTTGGGLFGFSYQPSQIFTRANLSAASMAFLHTKMVHSHTNLFPGLSHVAEGKTIVFSRMFSVLQRLRLTTPRVTITPPAPVTSGGVNCMKGPVLKAPALEMIRERLGVTPKMLLVLGHTASLFGVLALFMKDMLYLRTFMVCGSCCGVAFNILQPSPLKIPATWGCVFIGLNIFQIGVLLHERRPITFKSEEAEVYAAVFQKHGVTPHQFEKLMRKAGAMWLDLPAGHVILKEGELVDFVSVVVRGRTEVSKNGVVVGGMGTGCLVGETSLLMEGHLAGHTVVTSEASRIVTWPRCKLSQMLAGDQNLNLCAAQVINSDLSSKLNNSANLSNRAKILETYQDVMKGITTDGLIHPAEKRALREYRTTHHISQAQHLEAVKMCGWTPEEFEDGAKLDIHKPHFSLRQSIDKFNRSIAIVVGAVAHPYDHRPHSNTNNNNNTEITTRTSNSTQMGSSSQPLGPSAAL